MPLKYLSETQIKDWYLTSGTSSSVEQCPACHEAKICQMDSVLPEEWAIMNTEYEIEHFQSAFNAVASGMDIFDWSRQHWMFSYAQELTQGEYTTLVKSRINPSRFVHIGCGALPFTGIFFASVMPSVQLVDLDPVAQHAAQQFLSHLYPNTNHCAHQMNGKDFPFAANDLVLIASMVLNKEEIIQACAKAGVKDLFLRSSDDRPRHIFYQPHDNIAAHYGYELVRQTQPPLYIGNVTYHYQLHHSA